jgi:acetyl esterase/lipase
MPSYPLCPEASLGGIVRSCAAALEAAASRVPGPVRLSGHSAGGQVVARLAGMPLAFQARIEKTVPISPLSMLAPLRFTAMNATLGLTPEEAAAESPPCDPNPPRR